MALHVKPEIAFLPKSEIEAIADSLLRRYEAQEGSILAPPVPVEFIAEDFLGFDLKWDDLSYDVLACVDPNERVIHFNLARSDYFDHIGWEFTIAHEIGHPELGHFEEATAKLPLGLPDEPKQFLHREQQSRKYESHEFQAEYFAACLLIPRKLILPIVQKYDIYHWPGIYARAEQFEVSVTVMVKRLEALGLIYRHGKKLYGSKEEANGQRRLF